MKILNEKPPMFDEVAQLFKVTEKDPIFYAYGDVCYAPCGKEPPIENIVHEEVHLEQQEHNRLVAKIWWQRFLKDPQFRVQQEAEAYGMQLRFIRKRNHDRNFQARALHDLAAALSSEMYGKAIRYVDAMRLIRAYADGSAIKDIEQYMPDVEPAV